MWICGCSPPLDKTHIELVKPTGSLDRGSGEITDLCFNLSLPGLIWMMLVVKKETSQEKPSAAVAPVPNPFPECSLRCFIRLKSTPTASL